MLKAVSISVFIRFTSEIKKKKEKENNSFSCIREQRCDVSWRNGSREEL